LEFAKKHSGHGQDYWSNWIFSDESYVRLFDNSALQTIWSDKHQRILPKKRNEMSPEPRRWSNDMGAISTRGPGPLVFIEGSLNATKYRELAEDTILPYLGEKSAEFGRSVVFMDDNATPHCAGPVRQLFEQPPTDRLAIKLSGSESDRDAVGVHQAENGN
jgi:hypothetical protein